MSTIRVYLVRHAKAEKEAQGGDAARPLTPDGRRRFVTLVAELGAKLEVAQVLSSPFVRARQTADVLAAATGAPLVEDPDLASGRSGGAEVLAIARRGGAGTAVVGHNPEIGDAIALAAGEDLKVRPGTIAAIDLDGRKARLAWLDAPEKGE